jgi:hypothetical protein
MHLPVLTNKQLLGALVLLLVTLVISVWLLHDAHNCTIDPYYVQIWLPIILASASGALAMHINHVMYSKSVQRTVVPKTEDSFGDDDAY